MTFAISTSPAALPPVRLIGLLASDLPKELSVKTKCNPVEPFLKMDMLNTRLLGE